jgi:hypothetical protein
MLTAGQAVFQYTGGPQDWSIPDGVKSASVTLVGGLGGRDDSTSTFNMPAAQVQGTLTWTAGTTALNVWVGGNGGNATGTGSQGAGGFNGGAAGGTGSEDASAGGGGGGATDIRIGGYLPSTRVMVAGGSGGAGGTNPNGGDPLVGGNGGTGGAGTATAGVWPAGNGASGNGDNAGSGGAGGQIANGQSTVGGSAGDLTTDGGGGGGAGGYLGGAGGDHGKAGLVGTGGPGGGGGGGSSYADPTLVTNATASLATGIFSASATIQWVDISTTSVSLLKAGAATQQQLVASFPNNSYTPTWQVTRGALPAGLSLTTAGALSGTPRTAGNYSFQVTVTAQPNAVATSTRTYSGAVVTLPGAPTNVQGTPGYESVNLSWTRPSSDGFAEIAGYAVRYSTNGGGSWVVANSNTGSSTTAYTVNGLTSGVGYQFQVAAINGAGQGSFSASSAVVIPSGVKAVQSGNELSITVNGGSVAYLRKDGNAIDVAANAAFSFAQRFDPATVTSVIVNGNAANAGFFFTAGNLDASLTTSAIDSLSFGTTAAFSREVDATLSGRPLVVSSAVRGLGGVAIDAAMRLASDVEIDGGNGLVMITGTVDGQSRGGQSLTVTALGAIVFQQAVGATTPLKSLQTQATRSLRLSTDANKSRAIPLHYLPYTKPDGSVEDKYGIEVAVGTNPARMYEFDTGGPGLWAGYNPDWWQGVVPAANAAYMHTKYTSGNYFEGLATSAVLTLGSGSQKVSTGGAVQLTAITAGGNEKTVATFDFSTASKPPIEGGFFGDFGASFGIATTGLAVENPPQITNPLLQLPGNLSSGFVVQLGPLGTSPRLVVGITDDLRSQFPTAIELTKVAGLLYPNPNGASFRRQAYEPFAFSGSYSLSRDGQTFNLGTFPTLIDSGAPSTTIHNPDAPFVPSDFVSDGRLKPGTLFSGAFTSATGPSPFTWNLTAGDEDSVNAVEYTSAGSAASKHNSVNTGLDFYNGYDVMFDVATGYLRLRPSGGLSSVQVGSVTTLGAQRYGQNAILSGVYTTGGGEFSVAGATELDGGVTIAAGAGAVTFSGSVDSGSGGAQALAVNSSAATRFVRPVGGLRSLSSLTTDAPGSTSAVAVTTAGAQSFGDAATLAGIYTTTNSPFSVAGAATLAGAVTVQTTGVDGGGNGGTIRFSKSIDSQANTAFPLVLDSGKQTVTVSGAVGGSVPVGGITLTAATTATFASTVRLDGSGFGAQADGLAVADGVTVSLAAGGSIRRFTGSGVVFDKESKGSLLRGLEITDNVYDGIQVAARSAGGTIDYTGTVIDGNAIHGNGGFGIEAAGPVRGLTIRGNTIGREGTTNKWMYVTGGPNTHGIVLAPGNYPNTTISSNTIRFNRRSGIMMPGGVQGVTISGNTIERNAAHGIEAATGDFTGTAITANTIRSNRADGISLGAGIGQGTTKGGNPDAGYAAAVGHYLVSYANNPNFYDTSNPPPDPTIAMQVGTKQLTVNLDTGSRGLYFDALQLDSNITLEGPMGHVFLNSSNRLYFGQWSNQRITFTQSSFQGPSGPPDASRKAQAEVPILVVTAIGASTTPAPGAAVANTTFGTTIASGSITITNGTLKRTVGIVPNVTGSGPAGTVTIPGGWWANYADNMASATTSNLAPVANFGIGFDRSGQGTAPTTDSRSQLYNAFLNLTEMRNLTMRPGYVISATGVQLGLDSSVEDFAYTALAPTGLPQGTQSAPDWQPATGTVEYERVTSGTGQIVIDMGIPSGILTLPGKKPSSKFGGKMTVNLLNSGGAVRYGIDDSQSDNLLNPTDVAFFNPLAGTYTENLPPQSQQFFNTGRKVFAAFDYLYDAAAGFFGLRVGTTSDAQNAFASGNGEFTKGLYANPNAPTGVTNLTIGGTSIDGNTIAANDGNGVTVNGTGSIGNAILFNSIFANGGLGIDLVNGGNAAQVAPVLDPVMRLVGEKTIAVTGTLAARTGYSGTYTLQFFASPYSDGQTAASIEGRTYLGRATVSAGPFTASLPRGISGLGDWITVTATPIAGDPNTSEFSNATRVMTAVVDTAADAGLGSLRSAIALANANQGGEVIEFAIAPVPSPATILLASALPAITGPVLIDGRTQRITVNGARVAGAANGFTVVAAAAQTEIRSLSISGFARGNGIWSAAASAVFSDNRLAGNYNGIALVGGAGTTVSGNAITVSGNWGVYATGSLAGTSLVGNTITSTVLVGIFLQNATGVAVGRAGAGNTITGGTARGLYSTGIYVAGTSAGTRLQANMVSNNGSGVMLVDARGVLVGGTADAARNTITGNRGYGLFATGNSTGSVVQRNVISGNGRNVLTAKAFGLAYQG